jgi:hypothetical protein
MNSVLDECASIGVWVRLRMSKDTALSASTWRWWDTLRTMCGYNANLGILLEISQSGDMPPDTFENRWVGEPVRGLLVSTGAFLRNKRQFPVLPRSLQAVVTQVYKLGQQVCSLCPSESRFSLMFTWCLKCARSGEYCCNPCGRRVWRDCLFPTISSKRCKKASCH